MYSFQLAENELILPRGLQEVVLSCWAASPAQGIKLGPFWQRWLPWEASPGRMGRTGRVSGRRMAALPHPTHPHSQTPGQKSFLPQTYGSCSHHHTQTYAYPHAHKQTGDFVNMNPILPLPLPQTGIAHRYMIIAHRHKGTPVGASRATVMPTRTLPGEHSRACAHRHACLHTRVHTYMQSPLHPQLSDEGAQLVLGMRRVLHCWGLVSLDLYQTGVFSFPTFHRDGPTGSRESPKSCELNPGRYFVWVTDRMGAAGWRGGGLCHSWGRCLQGGSFCEADLSAFTGMLFTPFHPLTGLRPMFPSSVCVRGVGGSL